MDVRVRVFWAIDLDDPVNCGEVDTTSRDVSTEKHSMLLLNKLEVDGRALVLVLLTVQLKQVLRNFQGLEGLVGEAHLFPR